jgi:hypothetical protein
MKRNQGLFIRISDDEMNRLNSAWYDCVTRAGKPVSKSEFIRRVLMVFCDLSEHSNEEANDGK